jgi:hypothetical protein
MRLPALDTNTLKSELAFAVAKHRLHLPAASIGENDMPSLPFISDRLISQQIPGFAPAARTGKDEGK